MTRISTPLRQKRKPVYVELTPKVWREVKAAAALSGLPAYLYVERALLESLKHQEVKPKDG